MPKVPYSEHGIPLGDAHHRCTIPDAAVKAMLDMAAEGMGWRRIARAFPQFSAWTIKDIVSQRRRNVFPTEWRNA